MAQSYRIGIVGAGNISRLHLDGMKRHVDRVAAVAMCDPDAALLKTRAAEYQIPQAFPDLGAMIAGARLDAAIICTPTHIRRAVVEPLLRAKIPVLCEKPFAETYAEAAAMAKFAKEEGVPLAVGQNFRRHFAYELARTVIAQGELGNPRHLMQTVAVSRKDAGWRATRSRYLMSVMSIHWFDGYRFMLQDEPLSIYARGLLDGAGADHAVSMVIQFKRGAIACLSESFDSYTKPYSCCLDCERGGLVLAYDKLTVLKPGQSPVEILNSFDKPAATYWNMEDLLQAIEQKRSPEVSAMDNLNTMRMMEAAYRSIAENRIVQLEEIR